MILNIEAKKLLFKPGRRQVFLRSCSELNIDNSLIFRDFLNLGALSEWLEIGSQGVFKTASEIVWIDKQKTEELAQQILQ